MASCRNECTAPRNAASDSPGCGDQGCAGGIAHRAAPAVRERLRSRRALGASSLGALTYVGNAPNLMIYAMAVERGIAMPSFFGFMGWSGVVLLPAFAFVGWLYFS